MLYKIFCMVLLFIQTKEVMGNGYDEDVLEYLGDEDDRYEFIQEGDSEEPDPVRIKRYETRPAVKTLSPQEILEVRGAIKEILSGHENFFTPISSKGKNEKRSAQHQPRLPQNIGTPFDNYPLNSGTEMIDVKDEAADTKSATTSSNNDDLIIEDVVTLSTQELAADEDYHTQTTINIIDPTRRALPTRSFRPGNLRTDTDTDTPSLDTVPGTSPQSEEETLVNEEASTESLELKTTGSTEAKITVGKSNAEELTKELTSVQTTSFITTTTSLETTTITTSTTTTTPPPTTTTPSLTTTTLPSTTMTLPSMTTTPPPTTTTTRKRTRRTTTKFQLDVPALLEIIANLTYDYEMNLTDNLNETLLKLSVPTCETPTTTVKSEAFFDYDANVTGTIVAKCFVCGLTEEGIPQHAQCADAFAGDFLPLVPVDMTARGKISKYRKYCRYLDVNHYVTNSSMPRSVYGRWSGGCSVRWIDLSGVYTQRTCRNRERAILGRNYASKRMAKLEMALSNVENGCISSPMATLVPLSRGISLYARFHACVCTGSWCNAARAPPPAPLLALLISRLLIC